MKILSHRGYWKLPAEKNTLAAFTRSFRLGFGLETDIRDVSGKLVISHDVPQGDELPLDDFLELAASQPEITGCPLALNIKSDGLANLLAVALRPYAHLDCFVFDMAVPDMRGYFGSGIPVYTRLSEVEPQAPWLDLCKGVWLDCFESDWYSIDQVRQLLTQGKRVCIVSPELHGRAPEPAWEKLRAVASEPALMLCTDFPEAAQHFFD